MGMEVYANGMSIACKAASGKSIAAMPDVCLSPPSPPAGPIPIPYPNTSMASDATDGSKTVLINGQEVMLKNKSTFKTSNGNEAATKSLGMGVVTHQIQGKSAFLAWSMDVKFEGENVPRHLDIMGHNEASDPTDTPPWPYTDSMNPPVPAQKPCKADCPRKPKKEEYDQVRSKTPSPEIRKSINAKTPKTCSACGNVVVSLAADHIVSLKIISQMPGFACLSQENQAKVANSPDNFVGLCTSCNSSKRDKTWHRWLGIKKHKKVWDASVRDPARKQTNTQLKELKKKVKSMPCK
jgi:5-methylcytosine-specific restriction endonuclease McrA